MDFNKLNARGNADAGRKLHLVHPASGEPLFNDEAQTEPCLVIVRGSEGREAQRMLRALDRATNLTHDKPKKEPEESPTFETINDDLVRRAKILILGFENVMNGEKPAELDYVDTFLGLTMTNGKTGQLSFQEQILRFANDRNNYLGNSKAL